jgi:glucose-6-phosphate dehydrogenase assembly protein OpcA
MATTEQRMAARAMLTGVPEIERALAGLWAAARQTDGEPGIRVMARSNVLNLVVIATAPETAERCAATIAATAGHHPSRSLIISAVDPDGPSDVSAWIEALSVAGASGRADTGAETVHLTVRGEASHHLASVILPLLVHDLPVALWWPHDPQFVSRRADRLLPMAERLIVDGSSWSGDGLDRLANMASVVQRHELPVADFALMRQARWREALASVYDRPDLRPHLHAVSSITVEYSAAQAGDPRGLTNVVRPVYHVAWLAARLGMTVVEPFARHADGRRLAALRQDDRAVAVALVPVSSDLGGGSTVGVEIASAARGAALVGIVSAGDRTVDVVVRENDRERVRRSYLAPRLSDVELLGRAIEEEAPDRVAGETLAMARQLVASESKANRERRP